MLDSQGQGNVSAVIAAIDWAVQYLRKYGIRVLNLSIGRPVTESYQTDPLCQAVENAVKAGLVVVVSARNLGQDSSGQTVIGGITRRATRGCPDGRRAQHLLHGTGSDDAVTTYSSRGPTYIDELLKPDLVAPGNRGVSVEAPNSYLIKTYPSLEMDRDRAYAYMQLSYQPAAAVASGAVALLEWGGGLQADPSLTPFQVKSVLQSTSTFLPDVGSSGWRRQPEHRSSRERGRDRQPAPRDDHWRRVGTVQRCRVRPARRHREWQHDDLGQHYHLGEHDYLGQHVRLR